MNSLTRRTALLSAAASSQVRGANSRIAVGLIGCGNLGMRHLRLYQKPMLDEGLIRVAAISDIYTGAKRRAQQLLQLETKDVHHEYEGLIARPDLDAILVVTPEHWHHRMTLAALRAGKDVYLEKPMAFTVAEAKEIDETVRRTGRVLQVGAQWCSDPRYAIARDLIAAGAIGNVLWAQSTYSMNSVYGLWQYDVEEDATERNVDWPRFLGPAPRRPFSAERYFRWRKYWDYSNGVVADFHYHRLAPLLLALGGRFPTLVSANGGIYQVKDRETPDTFTMTAEYENFFLTIASSAASAAPERPFRHKQTERRIEATPSDLNAIRINHARNFYDCMRTRQAPVLNSRLGYQTMVAIKLAADSYRQRRTLAFDPKTEKVIPQAPAPRLRRRRA